MDGQDQRFARGLAEVDVLDQVAEDALLLAHVGAGVGSPIGPGVEAVATEEVVFEVWAYPQ